MIPLAVPNLTGNEQKYLDDCIATTFVSSVGAYVTRMEEMTAKVCGAAYAVATSAGTTGLHAALTACGVGRDDLVILPSFTFIASANAIAHCGAMPWLFDIRKEDWCLDPDAVRLAIERDCDRKNGKLYHKSTGKRVAAVMPVYTLGNLPDMIAFRKIADQYELPLIADAACAVGATFDGETIGALADLSVLSFNGNKTITCGGGGMVLGNDKALSEHVRHLTTTARIGSEYDFDEVGFNYRMTNIQAAVGCAQMERLDMFVERKRAVRAFYEKELAPLHKRGITFFPTTPGSACWFSGIVLDEKKQIADVRKLGAVLRERGIESRTFWKPVHLQKPYQNALTDRLSLTEKLWERVVTLPCSTGMTDAELLEVRDVLLQTLS